MAENTIPAVEKAVAVLTRLGESEGGLTQAELAGALDIAPGAAVTGFCRLCSKRTGSARSEEHGTTFLSEYSARSGS